MQVCILGQPSTIEKLIESSESIGIHRGRRNGFSALRVSARRDDGLAQLGKANVGVVVAAFRQAVSGRGVEAHREGAALRRGAKRAGKQFAVEGQAGVHLVDSARYAERVFQGVSGIRSGNSGAPSRFRCLSHFASPFLKSIRQVQCATLLSERRPYRI